MQPQTLTDVHLFDKQKFICRFTLLGLLVAVIYHFCLMRPPISSPGYPYNTFLYWPADRFNDFWNTVRPYVQLQNPYSFPISVYFPAIFVILFLFQAFGRFVFIAFLVVSITGMFFLCYYIQSAKQRSVLMVIALMLSYPFLFAVDRGNLDLLLLNLVFLWWVLRARGHDVAASMCIGFVGAAKLVPLLLLLPDLVNLRIRRVFLPAAFAIAFTGLGLIAIGEPIERSLQLLSRNHETWNRLWILKGQCIPYSHNLLSAVKTLALAYCLKSHIPVQPIHEFSFQ